MQGGRNKKAFDCGSSPSARAVKEATGHGLRLRSGTEGVMYLPCLAMLGDCPGVQIFKKKKVDLRGENFLLEVKTLSGLT